MSNLKLNLVYSFSDDKIIFQLFKDLWGVWKTNSMNLLFLCDLYLGCLSLRLCITTALGSLSFYDWQIVIMTLQCKSFFQPNVLLDWNLIPFFSVFHTPKTVWGMWQHLLPGIQNIITFANFKFKYYHNFTAGFSETCLLCFNILFFFQWEGYLTNVTLSSSEHLGSPH